MASGETTVTLKLEVKDNSGYSRSVSKEYVIKESRSRRYFIKDHLGSTRAVVNAGGTVLQATDYYPFGLIMDGRSYLSGSPAKEGFTGKERDDETGFDHFGARTYSSELGRFMQIDPLASEFPNISPYAYGNNNPMRYTDPTGMAPMDWIKDLETEEYVWDNNVNSAGDTPEGFAYVGKSLDDVAADFEASTPWFNLWSKPNVNTDGWPGEIRTTQEGFWDGRENNIGYGLINSPWVAVQTLNPGDNQVTHLNGNLTTHNERLQAGAESAPIGMFGSMASGLRLGLNVRRYANAGGAGVNVTKAGERYIGLDWHRFKVGGRKTGTFINRPHVDIPSQGVEHWPWHQIDKLKRGVN